MKHALPAILLLAASSHVHAATSDWPIKPIRFVVPFVAGGPNDIQGRIIGEKLSQRLGQQVVIDNRGGAGGNIGMEITAKAPADGYTIVIATVGTWAVNPYLYKTSFDVLKDFTHISMVSTSPGVLALHPGVAARNVKELIALAKEKPRQLNYGSSGVGGFGHISGELFTYMTGTQMTHVPYKSSAPSLTDLIGGQIQVLFNNAIATVPHVKGNRVRAIATTGAARTPALPDLPTVAEAGVPGYDNSSWSAIGGPPGMPRAIATRLNREIVDILKLPDVQQKHTDVGADIVAGTPEQFQTYLKSELEKFGKLVKAAGIKGD